MACACGGDFGADTLLLAGVDGVRRQVDIGGIDVGGIDSGIDVGKDFPRPLMMRGIGQGAGGDEGREILSGLSGARADTLGLVRLETDRDPGLRHIPIVIRSNMLVKWIELSACKATAKDVEVYFREVHFHIFGRRRDPQT